MSTLTKSTILQRIPEVDLTLESNGEVLLIYQGTSTRVGPSALGLLKAFSRPRSFGEGLGALASGLCGGLAIEDAVEDTIRLVEIGVLRPRSDEQRLSDRPYPFGMYDSPASQVRLLNDRRRRTAFIKAVRQTVRPGDVVLDLGTGCGIMAVAAVQAGARHVYAVEPSAMAGFAERIFEENGVQDRVTVIRGWSQSITLPERADVLTSDLVGFEGLDLKLLEIVDDAIARHLAPGYRLVPASMGFRAYLGELSRELIEAHAFSKDRADEWSKWYGMELKSLAADAHRQTIAMYLDPSRAASLDPISAPHTLWQVDFSSPKGFASRGHEASFTVDSSAENVGVIGSIVLTLTNGVELSMEPALAGEHPHWMTPLWFLPGFGAVRTGEQIDCAYQYVGRGRSRLDMSRGGDE